MGLGPLMLDLEGLSLSNEEQKLIGRSQVGGVILFSRNYQDKAQLYDLVLSIRDVRPDLLIAVDHEGGRVQRFKTGLTRIPDMFALATHKPEWLMPAGELMALELLALGVDFSFAPVLDVDRSSCEVIADRSFADDPDAVSKAAGHFIAGMHEAGMAATGKHFPGHGGVRADSHL